MASAEEYVPSATGIHRSSVTAVAAATTTINNTPTTIPAGYGRLLDLADLDGYLLSLLSSDLAEACAYALVARKAIARAVSKEPITGDDYNPFATQESSSSSSFKSSSSWWKWEDVLAFVTICVSRGQTPAAQALGFHLVEPERGTAPDSNQQQSARGLKLKRRSFYARLLGALPGRDMHISSSNNHKNSFRNKILLYAILRILLPRLYERMKSKGLEYANQEDDDDSSFDGEEEEQQLSLRLQAQPLQRPQKDIHHSGFEGETSRESPLLLKPSSSSEAQVQAPATRIRALALQRRKLVVRTVIRWLDGIILPSMRVALLLSFWTGHDRGHGGNLALWWSGLSYRPQPPTNTTDTTTAAAAATNSTTPVAALALPLYVMYAHRRWLHKEAMELLWNRIGRGLLAVHVDTSAMWSAVSSRLRNEWRVWVVRWSYKLAKLQRKIRTSIRITAPDPLCDNESATKTANEEPCPLCGTNNMVVPYRLECCGKVACYTCLWERLASTTSVFETLEATGTVRCPFCYEDISRCERI